MTLAFVASRLNIYESIHKNINKHSDRIAGYKSFTCRSKFTLVPNEIYFELFDQRANNFLNKRPEGPHILHLSTMCHLFDGLARMAILVY